jgi:NAD(P)-dependent dehydrogenase (short-subunit alcohol dehydrogenase family)
MRALVTGAGGFLGAALVRALAARGDPVRALVRSPPAPGTFPAGVEVLRGDALDPATVRAAVRGQDVVFHLAGLRRATERDAFFPVNAGSTRIAFEACEAEAPGLRRFVLAGSITASGPSREGRPEEAPPRPVEAYGESKAEAERIAFSFAGRVPVAVARPPRIVGPGDRENLLFFQIPPGRVPARPGRAAPPDLVGRRRRLRPRLPRPGRAPRRGRPGLPSRRRSWRRAGCAPPRRPANGSASSPARPSRTRSGAPRAGTASRAGSESDRPQMTPPPASRTLRTRATPQRSPQAAQTS